MRKFVADRSGIVAEEAPQTRRERIEYEVADLTDLARRYEAEIDSISDRIAILRAAIVYLTELEEYHA